MTDKERKFYDSLFENLIEENKFENLRKNKLKEDKNETEEKESYPVNIMIGYETEENCILSLLKKGYKVSRPVLQNCPYDLIVDIDNKLYKIQVKTSHWIDEENKIFGFYSKKDSNKSYTKETIDYFMTYIDGESYLIPFDKTHRKINKFSLNKESTVRYAGNFLLEQNNAVVA